MPKPIIKKNTKGHALADIAEKIECNIVNVLTIDGKTYKAFRGIQINGRDIEKVKEYVECEGEKRVCRLKEVWPDKLLTLFK